MKIKLTRNIVITGSLIITLLIAGVINIYSNNKEYIVKDNSEAYIDEKEDGYPSGISKIESDLNSEDIFLEQDKAISPNSAFVTVFISGEVLNPKVITLEKGKRLVDAIELCGGLTEKANLNAVNLALILQEEQHYVVPAVGDAILYDNSAASHMSNTDAQDGLVDINSSDADNLKTLPGIGDVLAQRIIEKREELGRFDSIEQLQEVSGIGDKKFLDIKDKVKIK